MNFKVFKHELGTIRFLKGTNDLYYSAQDVVDILGYNLKEDMVSFLNTNVNRIHLKVVNFKDIGEMTFVDTFGLEQLMNKISTKQGKKFRKWYVSSLLNTLEPPIIDNYKEFKNDNDKDNAESTENNKIENDEGKPKSKTKKKKAQTKHKTTTKKPKEKPKFIWSGGRYYVSVERTFSCRQCGTEVSIDSPDDKRSVFCCQQCEKKYWRLQSKHKYRDKMGSKTYTNGNFIRKLVQEKAEAEEFRGER